MKRVAAAAVVCSLVGVGVVALRHDGGRATGAPVVDVSRLHGNAVDRASSAQAGKQSRATLDDRIRDQRRLASSEPSRDDASAASSADELQEMPLPDLGVLDPFTAIALTKAEYREFMLLVEEGLQRQLAIDRQEQNGDISLDEHARLSAEFSDEMDGRIDDILGSERAEIFAQVTSRWAEKAVPAVLGTNDRRTADEKRRVTVVDVPSPAAPTD